MKVYIVRHEDVIYSVFATKALAEAYIKDTFVKATQAYVRIEEEEVVD